MQRTELTFHIQIRTSVGTKHRFTQRADVHGQTDIQRQTDLDSSVDIRTKLTHTENCKHELNLQHLTALNY